MRPFVLVMVGLTLTAAAASAEVATAVAPPRIGNEPTGEGLRQTARGLIAKHGDAVVTVRLVLKRRVVVQGQERGSSESQTEILGTIISPSGLTVVADSDSDPSSLFSGGDSDGPKVDTDTSDVKILLPDGREIPARFVLRDRDLDLAFVMPEAADLKLPYVPLEAAKVPQPLDDVVFLYRAGKNLNREVCITVGQVQAVVHKPRTFVISEPMNALAALGGPVFDGQGGLVGMVVLRRSPTAAADARLRGPLRGAFDMITPVILTVADVKSVADDATRAAAAKP
jgi:S1-C subfamily serine protease